MLLLDKISAHYGMICVLKKISIHVNEKNIVSIIGANGAGKSTLFRVIGGLIPSSEGRIIYQDKDITKLPSQQLVKLGIRQVLEGRQIFTELTTLENLKLGGFVKAKKNKRKKIDMEYVYNIFPRLRNKYSQLAGTLSGGEQQMLAIGRAIIGHPKLLLLDEPSLGLAPLVVTEILRVVTELKDKGMTIILVEQRARKALEISDYGYVLELGKIVHQGKATELLGDEKVRRAYLGERSTANDTKGV